jgi:hypothetical protein
MIQTFKIIFSDCITSFWQTTFFTDTALSAETLKTSASLIVNNSEAMVLHYFNNRTKTNIFANHFRSVIVTCDGFVRQKRRKQIPFKLHLLLIKKWSPLPPSLFNEPGTLLGGSLDTKRGKKVQSFIRQKMASSSAFFVTNPALLIKGTFSRKKF